MYYAYSIENGRLVRLAAERDVADAAWIDLIQPNDAEIAQLRVLGVPVPSLAEMEEIELSNRLYREDGLDYMTAMLPGERAGGDRISMPVTFILSTDRLVTVRHHSPRPFLTYPERAERSTLGCGTPDRLFLGLVEEIIARLADILEGAGRTLDQTTAAVFERRAVAAASDRLQAALQDVGREAETMARVRLALLTVERMQAFYTATLEDRPEEGRLRAATRAQMRDIQALEVHADFLGGRVSLAVDTTLGLINLQQNNTVRILSVVAALFLPPTLIASVYGMNFTNMPELDEPWGYAFALILMGGTTLGTWLFLRWKGWI
ncbi:magnesium transporter [Paracoccus sp. S4493]|uniref:Magnesium transporter CorA family protein n=1 Tax=Paracoccus marcusii TaxID=59779 RepID=A0ABY7US48_9RHOB|nr:MULTISPECIES: magnesium transporter CorA family protein [Paracoccus]KJZ32192.1 magnesium transporter [Paracoccus sp. S4493]MCO6361961.1 magnesium transporter [Paracoccus sp. 08]QXI63166.1 Magnesium transport protein CorA [Paracoccus marcusii]TNC05677.1 magnesium transporter [Paracoccus marcusii]WDA12771.1 magnesium transporter CorA family protein [Paracoccus marcusii]